MLVAPCYITNSFRAGLVQMKNHALSAGERGGGGDTSPSKLAVANTPGELGDHSVAKFQLLLGGSSASTSPAKTSHTIVLQAREFSSGEGGGGGRLVECCAVLKAIQFPQALDSAHFRNRSWQT